MRHRRPTLRIEHLWAALPFSFVLWAGFHAPLPLTDFWVYLRFGEVIADLRSIPAVDLFSYTAAGTPFASQNWLACLIYAAANRLGGLEALVVLNALILVLALAVTLGSTLAEAGRLRPALGGAAFAAWGLIFQRAMRPQTFSFLFFAIFVWVAMRLRGAKQVPWWIPAVAMALWVNLHGAFVLGLACLVVVAAADVATRRAAMRPYVKATAAAILGTFLNPKGPRVYAAVYEVATDTASQKLTQEWLAPSILDVHSILAFFIPLIAVGLALLFSPRRLTVSEAVLLGLFAIFAATARRNAIWFSLVAAPVMAAHFGSIRPRERNVREMPAANLVIALFMIALTIAISPWVYPYLGVRGLGNTLMEPRTPVGAVDFIRENGVRGRIFHPQEYGDYMIWKLWPEHRSFLDSRIHLFDEEIVFDYMRIGRGAAGWEQILDRYRCDWILLPDDREHAAFVHRVRRSPRWQLQRSDGQTVLFRRVKT